VVLLTDMQVKKTVLDNGLRVVMVNHPDSIAATVLVLVEAGSKYEAKDINGLSHFLEHMCFKGTTNRPSSMVISSEFDSLGAKFNAFTAQECTGYFATVRNKYLPHALDLVADMYLNPTFPAAEIEKEKGVIVEEINMYEDMPARSVQDLFLHLLYGDTPAGWNIAGTKEVVRALNRDNFIAYRNQHYVASATTVVVAGAINEGEVVELVAQKFAPISTGAKGAKLALIEEQTKPAVIVKEKKSDQCHLVLGFRAFGLFDPRVPAVELLAAVLGGGMSSRLFHKVREQLGAAYYVRALFEGFTDHGFLELSAGVDLTKVHEVIAAMLQECKRLTVELVPEVELRRVKDSLIGHLYLELETSSELAIFFGTQEILKKQIVEPDAWAQKIEQITAPQLQELARALFRNEGLNLAVIGPFGDSGPFVEQLKL
jgi:predicted Zn-dependent peptidase